jgi:hypothetical protein
MATKTSHITQEFSIPFKAIFHLFLHFFVAFLFFSQIFDYTRLGTPFLTSLPSIWEHKQMVSLFYNGAYIPGYTAFAFAYFYMAMQVIIRFTCKTLYYAFRKDLHVKPC